MNRKCHVISTINLINALFDAQEHLMCPAHVECQKFQIPSPQLHESQVIIIYT